MKKNLTLTVIVAVAVLLGLTMKHEVHYHWVKGHAENPKNNRCDEMAVSEWKKLKA